MKKIVTAAALAGTLAALAVTPALASDMLVKKAPPPPRAPVWSWTGFYVGANIGGGWANTDWFEDAFGSGGGGPPGFEDGLAHSSGVLGGGQIGFDYQNGWAVFGIQADADAAGIRGSTGCFPEVFGIPQSCTTKIDALGTVIGRFGVAFDRTLLYVLGGFAWEHERLNNPGFIPGGVSFNPEFSGTRSGATVGAGIEWALAGNWSAFVQYNYLGFGKRALVLRENDPAVALLVGSSFTEIIHEDVQVIKAGVNYRFNWGPGGSATPASAEPMAMKAPARVAALPSTNWTGFYIGANAGAAWERASLNSTLTSCPTCSVSFDPADQAAIAAAGSPTINTTNFTGGVEAGYNLQSGQPSMGSKPISMHSQPDRRKRRLQTLALFQILRFSTRSSRRPPLIGCSLQEGASVGRLVRTFCCLRLAVLQSLTSPSPIHTSMALVHPPLVPQVLK